MRLVVQHFDGDMEDLGLDFGAKLDTELHRRLEDVQTNRIQVSEPIHQFLNGVSEVTQIEPPVLGGIMTEAQQEAQGSLTVWGGKLLACRYRFKQGETLLVYYGQCDGRPFFFMSIAPHPPGSLLGMNRSGVAWARRVPHTFRSDDYEVMQLVEHPLESVWGHISILRLRSNFTVAAPFDHRIVKTQSDYRHKAMPTPESAARKSFEDARSNTDVLVLLDTTSREVTIIRGTGQEVTFDLNADF